MIYVYSKKYYHIFSSENYHFYSLQNRSLLHEHVGLILHYSRGKRYEIKCENIKNDQIFIKIPTNKLIQEALRSLLRQFRIVKFSGGAPPKPPPPTRGGVPPLVLSPPRAYRARIAPMARKSCLWHDQSRLLIKMSLLLKLMMNTLGL